MNDDQRATFVQGDTQYFVVSVVDGNGNAVDLTGADIEYTLSHKDATVTKTRGDDVSVTDAVAGEFEVHLKPSDTTDISGAGSHSVEITDSDGDVATVLSGAVSITEL